MVLNVVAVIALRRSRRNVTTWVLVFCVLQYFAAIHSGPNWALGGVNALLFSRFRLSLPQSVSLHAMMAAAVFGFASFNPIPSENPHFSDAHLNLMLLVLNLLFMVCAFALQTVGTRRVRREILETWHDPLQNAREQVRMRDELHYARQLQLSM